MTKAQRIEWHYAVARMKGEVLTQRDVWRLDDLERLGLTYFPPRPKRRRKL